MPTRTKTIKRQRGGQLTANDLKVLNWAIDKGIITKRVGKRIINERVWSFKVNPRSKHPTSYRKKIRDRLHVYRSKGGDVPPIVTTFLGWGTGSAAVEEVEEAMRERQMAGVYAAVGAVEVDVRAKQKKRATEAAEEITRREAQRTGRAAAEQAEHSMRKRQMAGAYAAAGAIAEELGMNKPEDILNVKTDGEPSVTPMDDIKVPEQKLNDGPGASADHAGDGQLDGARQRHAMEDIDEALRAVKRKAHTELDVDVKRQKKERTGVKRAAEDEPKLPDPKAPRTDDTPPSLPSTPAPSVPPLEPMPRAPTPPGSVDPVIEREETKAKSLEDELKRLNEEIDRQDREMAEKRRLEHEAKTKAEKDHRQKDLDELMARIQEADRKRKEREDELKRVDDDLKKRYERLGRLRKI